MAKGFGGLVRASGGGGGGLNKKKKNKPILRTEKMNRPGHTIVQVGSSLGLALATKKMGSVPTPFGITVKPDVAGAVVAGAVAVLGKGKSKALAASVALGAIHAIGLRWVAESSGSTLSAGRVMSDDEKRAKAAKREADIRDYVREEVKKETDKLSEQMDAIMAMLKKDDEPVSEKKVA